MTLRIKLGSHRELILQEVHTSPGAGVHTVYFEGHYIVCDANKGMEREKNEFISNTSYCNHRI